MRLSATLRTVLGGIGLAALAACSTPMDMLDTLPGRAETYVNVTAEGAGPLTAATAYDSKAILAAMPGYTSGSVLIGLETETANALVLFHQIQGGQVQVLQILPGPEGKIGQIHGVSQHVEGPAGERPGMSFADAKADIATCRMGTTLWIGMVICRSKGAPNVLLSFSLKSDTPPGTSLPPAAQLKDAELQRIIWMPKP